MKRLNIIFISIILIFSLFIVTTYKKNSTIPNNDESSIVSSTPSNNKMIYLTFDDGPSDNTIKILNLLDKYEIQATFFVVGPSYKQKNDLLLEIVNRGHKLAIHSYSHEYQKIYKSKEAYLEDFYRCYNWIKELTNISPTLYRFPGGSSTTITSKSLIEAIIIELEANGFKHVDWNVDSFDSHYNEDIDAITTTTLSTISHNENNKIYSQTILFHDNSKKKATLLALSTVIEKCLSSGYKFETLNNQSKLIQHVKKPT